VQGNLVRWYGINIDIDDRKRAEQKLQQNEASLYRITQTIPGILWSATPEGTVDYCNGPWLDFVSMTAEQAAGWGWVSAIYPDDRDGLLECWRSCLASGTPLDMEARTRRFDGTYRWFIFRANPLRDESGKIVRWYGANTEIEDRKHREEMLQASEQSWRQIIDNIPGYVHTTSARGEVQFQNRQTLEDFGKTKVELKEWGRNDIVHPDDLPRVIDAWKKSVETGQNYEMEQRNRGADGVYRWFQCPARPVRNADGEITAWYWLLTDIEDRKRAEQALQANERRLSLMIDAIPTFIQVSEPDGTVLSINQGVLDYHGLSLKDMQKEDFRDRYYHPDDVKRLREEREEALKHPVPFEYEQRALAKLGKDGTYRWFLVRYKPLLDEHGRIERWYVAAFDIEDRKRAEQKVHQSEEDLRTILDAIRQAVLVLGADGTTLYANRVALEITGRTMEDIRNSAYFQVATFHPDDEARFRVERQAGLSRGTPFGLEVRVLHPNGEYRWFLNQYNPLRDEHGNVSRWYVTATDINDQKKTEGQLPLEKRL
jgi:PAS domain S-box-containing protein